MYAGLDASSEMSEGNLHPDQGAEGKLTSPIELAPRGHQTACSLNAPCPSLTEKQRADPASAEPQNLVTNEQSNIDATEMMRLWFNPM